MAGQAVKNHLFYFISDPSDWGINARPINAVEEHHALMEYKGHLVVWPKKLDSTAVCLAKFKDLKEKTGFNDWLIVDSLYPAEKIYNIKNHINRSGENFLRASTPFDGGVMFLDISNIYKPVDRLPSITVSTIGFERFGKETGKENTIWSLGAGLVSPVAHYLGIKVSAVGTNPGYEKIDAIFSI